jgi:radical SAM protein with 4Fe4S-binding SPASM domain
MINSNPYYNEIPRRLRQHIYNIGQILIHPQLRTLVWEATRNCNLSCFHCCIPKADWRIGSELTTQQAKRIFAEIAEDLNPKEIHVAITGGEPTLRKDLIEMVKFLSDLSFKTVGVDSNGINYAKDLSLLDKLVEAGMTVGTIGVDGLREGYKKTRGVDYFNKIINVLRYVISKYSDMLYLTTFTVVNNYNKNEIPELMEILADIGLKYARVSPVSKIGRAASVYERLYKLSPQDLYSLLQWIANKREEYKCGKFPMEIELSDDGWCGLKYELLTKSIEHIFFCATGITVASILYDGKISACPHISRDLTIQGDALKERFSDVWNNRFQSFRNKNWLKKGKCKACDQWVYCRGGAMHYRDKDGTMKQCIYDDVKEVDHYEKRLRSPKLKMIQKGGITMARIKIKDLPRDRKISKEELRQVFGGLQVLGGLQISGGLKFPKDWIAQTQMIPSSYGYTSVEVGG